MCAIPTRYPLGFDEPLVVDLSDEVGRPVALSEDAGADNDLKYATVLGGLALWVGGFGRGGAALLV